MLLWWWSEVKIIISVDTLIAVNHTKETLSKTHTWRSLLICPFDNLPTRQSVPLQTHMAVEFHCQKVRRDLSFCSFTGYWSSLRKLLCFFILGWWVFPILKFQSTPLSFYELELGEKETISHTSTSTHKPVCVKVEWYVQQLCCTWFMLRLWSYLQLSLNCVSVYTVWSASSASLFRSDTTIRPSCMQSFFSTKIDFIKMLITD